MPMFARRVLELVFAAEPLLVVASVPYWPLEIGKAQKGPAAKSLSRAAIFLQNRFRHQNVFLCVPCRAADGVVHVPNNLEVLEGLADLLGVDGTHAVVAN